MSRSNVTRAAVAIALAGASLVWGGSNLHGQSAAAPEGAAAGGPGAVAPRALAPAATVAPTTPVVGGDADRVLLGMAPGLASGLSVVVTPDLGVDLGVGATTGVMLPPPPGLDGHGVAAIPLPPSAYPGMIGLATAAFAGWRYRRRRRR